MTARHQVEPAFLCLLPKIELHRHLVGSVRVETLLDIACEYDVPLPADNLEELKALIEVGKPVSEFRQFLKPLKIVGLCFCDKKSIARITYEAAEDAARDNIKYMELAIGPAFEASFHHLPLEEVFDGIIDGIAKAEERYDIKINLIASPTFKWRERQASSPNQVLETALQHREKVVGFGLPAETKEGVPFSEWPLDLKTEYRMLAETAKEQGLYLTVHAGEVGPAQSVMDAIRHLKADRIGHGIKCIEKPNIMKNVIKARKPLEICISSNIKSGVVKNLKQHPVKELYGQGALLTINTDDPTLCNTTLSKEYGILVKNFNFSYQHLKELIFNALSAAFLSDKEKDHLRRKLQRYFTRLEKLNSEKAQSIR